MGFTFKKAAKSQAKAKIALIGPAGSGKTKDALILASRLGRRIAVIDTENGTSEKYAGDDGIEFDVLRLESFEPRTYVDAINAAVAEGFDVVIIDSLSHAWVGKGGALEQVDKITKRNGGSTFNSWRDVTPQHNEMVDALVRCPAHLIVTMRAKTEYVQEKDDRGKTTIRKMGLAPVQRDGLEYEFDVVADLTPENDVVISKTRCSEINRQVYPAHDVPKLGETLRRWLSDGAQVAQGGPLASEAPKLSEAGQKMVAAIEKSTLDKLLTGATQLGAKPQPREVMDAFAARLASLLATERQSLDDVSFAQLIASVDEKVPASIRMDPAWARVAAVTVAGA